MRSLGQFLALGALGQASTIDDAQRLYARLFGGDYNQELIPVVGLDRPLVVGLNFHLEKVVNFDHN